MIEAAATAIYLLGATVSLRAVYGDPAGVLADLGRAVAVAGWPIPFSVGMVQGLFSATRRSL